MKKLKAISRGVSRRCLLLLGLCLLGIMTTVAQEAKWLLVTNDGTKIDMETVGSIVIADQSDAFDVLNTQGSVLAAKVKKVTFEYADLTGIEQTKMAEGATLLSYAVDRQLTIMGSALDAQVYSAAGELVASDSSKGGTIVIDVSRLSSGVYMVRAGKQTFKFIKK